MFWVNCQLLEGYIIMARKYNSWHIHILRTAPTHTHHQSLSITWKGKSKQLQFEDSGLSFGSSKTV